MRKALLALLLAAGVTPALAQEKTFDLKISHWVPSSHPLQKSLEDWAAAVEKDSGGTIKSKVFPAQQLGKAFDHYDMARDGIADVTYVNPYRRGASRSSALNCVPDVGRAPRWRSTLHRKCAEKEMRRQVLSRLQSTPSSFHRGPAIKVAPDDIMHGRSVPAVATMGEFRDPARGTTCTLAPEESAHHRARRPPTRSPSRGLSRCLAQRYEVRHGGAALCQTFAS